MKTLSLISLLFLFGCAGADSGGSYSPPTSGSPSHADSSVSSREAESSFVSTSNRSPASQAASPAPANSQPDQDVVPSVQKIIYRAHVDVIVEEFDGVSVGLTQLCQRHSGFIANANISGRKGDPRRGTWTLRVPSSEYRAFLSSVSDVGEVTSSRETSQEVTAEFYDVQARIRNKQREELRLVDLLENQVGKLPDILTVEKELSRVRGEVEQMQGRLRVLKDLTEYSTVTVNVQEIKNYVPPAAPSFMTEVARQWESTLLSMLKFGQGFILIVVGFGPWVVLFSLVTLLAYLVVRRWNKKSSKPVTV